MYSLADYAWMIADETRVAAYADAIRASVRPGDRVLDVGAGFGFFSVIAALAGAAHVDAVDTNPAVQIGPRLAAANGCADRIAFHQLDVGRLALDRRADLVISDLRGPTPFAGRALAVLIDVRRRLLHPGGIMIPSADTLFVAPARVPATVRREIHAAYGQQGIVTSPVERVLEDTPYRCSIEPEDLIAPGQAWGRIDYGSVDSADADGAAEWTLDTAAEVSGFAVWFDTALAGSIGFSSAPGAPARAYRQIYVPLRRTVSVGHGDRLRIHLTLKLVQDDYVWAWRVFLTPAHGGPEQEIVRQNSLAERIVDPADLRRRASRIGPPIGKTGVEV